MPSKIVVSFLFAGLISEPILAGNWPQFRGPNINGIVSDSQVALEWASDKNIRWKTALPGTGWSQPVVWGNRIYITAAETENQKKPKGGENDPGPGILLGSPPPNVVYRHKVLCLDGATGKILWQITAHEGKPRIVTHRNNTYASETPVIDGERIIAYFGMTGLFALDLSGKLLWNKDIGAYPMQFGWGTGSSPILYNGRVFLQCDNEKSSFVIALDVKTGNEIWRIDRDEKSNWCSPYIWKNSQRTELVCAGGKRIRSYNPDDGRLLWELKANGRTAVTPIGNDEMIFVDSEDRITGVRGSITAVRAGASGDISLASGEPSSDSVAWTISLNLPRIASPLLLDNHLYVFAQQGGFVHCYDAATGAERYSQRLSGISGFTSSPIVANGRIYCIDEAGTTVVLKPGSTFEILARNVLEGETFWSSPAVIGDDLLFRGTDCLYCIMKEQ
jgi:outer membrane protein assembly factor BamB